MMLVSKSRATIFCAGWSLLLLVQLLTQSLPVSLAAETNSSESEILDSKDEALLDQELKDAFEDAKRMLTTYNEAQSKLSSLSKDIIDGKGKQKSLSGKIKDVEDMKDAISEKKGSIDAAVRDINARQILDLKEKLELLQTRETERRARLKKKEQLEEKRKKKLEEKKKRKKQTKESKIPEKAILKEELSDKLDIESIIEESDKEIEDFFLGLADKELEKMQDEIEEIVINANEELGEMEDSIEKTATTSDDDCSGPSLEDAVQIVQEELVKYSKDKVGMVDHLSRAKIVHHLTSNNYQPEIFSPFEESLLYKYLPEDWERWMVKFLPEGWRQWNTAIPDFLYHSSFGFLTHRAQTAPPEATLQPDIYPGSCWPMEGDSGQVTFRLPYPVRVKAVTIDHAPKKLLADEEKRKSAPKGVRVFGYPPCWQRKGDDDASVAKKINNYDSDDDDDDEDEYVRGICDDGLSFDVSKPIVLHDFEYKLTGPSIQTFQIPLPAEEEDDNEGNCSTETNTCGGSFEAGGNQFLFASPDRLDYIKEGVSAIRFEITDNWGNKDYTCIYRFRIHGDALDPSE